MLLEEVCVGIAVRDDGVCSLRKCALEARHQSPVESRRIDLDEGVELVRVVDEAGAGPAGGEVPGRQRVDLVRVDDVEARQPSSGAVKPDGRSDGAGEAIEAAEFPEWPARPPPPESRCSAARGRTPGAVTDADRRDAGEIRRRVSGHDNAQTADLEPEPLRGHSLPADAYILRKLARGEKQEARHAGSPGPGGSDGRLTVT